MKHALYLNALFYILLVACKKEDHPNAREGTLSADSTTLSLSGEAAASNTFTISSTVEWNVQCSDDWLQTDIITGNGNRKIVVSARQAHRNNTPRTGTILVVAVDSSLHLPPIAIMVTQTRLSQSRNAFGGSKNEEFVSALATGDGGYIAVGVTNSNDGDISGLHGELQDVWIAKLNAAHQIVWQKALGGMYEDEGCMITKTADGNYLVAGAAKSRDGDLSGLTGIGILLVKISGDGNVLWKKIANAGQTHVGCIRPANGGGHIITGGENSSQVVKIDENGTVLWVTTIDGPGPDVAYAAVPVADGYLVSGACSGNGVDFSGNHGLMDVYVAKLDEDGHKLWIKCYGGTSNDRGYELLKTSDGFLVFAQTFSNDGDVSGNHGVSDVWIFKVDGAGAIQWQKTYGGSRAEAPGKVVLTSDGNYMMGGVTWESGSQDGWALKIDGTGTQLWHQRFGGSKTDLFFDVQEISPSKFVGVGQTNSNDLDVYGYNNGIDGWLMPFQL